MRAKLLLSVFIAGGAVMVFELLGSRVMAPYVGGSIYAWTSLIGVILAALSLGYWLGGAIADKDPKPERLALFLTVAGLAIAAVAAEKDAISYSISQLKWSMEMLSVLTAVVLFALPSLFLGMISPYAARLALSDVRKGGRTFGSISALSTLGSIVGTFAAGYWIIPSFGTTMSLFGLALILLMLALLWTRRRGIVLALLMGVWLWEWSIQEVVIRREQAGAYDIDTPYQRVWVYEMPIKGEKARMFQTDHYGVMSGMLMDKPDEMVFSYTRFFEAVFVRIHPKNIIIAGGAGYTLPVHLARNNPEVQVTTVEIDPKNWEIAQKFFGAKTYPNLKNYQMDVRNFFAQEPIQKADIVFYDVFSGIQPPFHTTTLEAFTDLKKHLTLEGRLVVNLVDVSEPDHAEFVTALKTTLGEIFPSVQVYRLDNWATTTRANYAIVAGPQEPSLFVEGENLGGVDPATVWAVTDFSKKSLVLTDDYAPVESLLRRFY